MAAPTYSWDEDSAETRVAPPSRWPHSARIIDDDSDERRDQPAETADSALTQLIRRPSWRSRTIELSSSNLTEEPIDEPTVQRGSESGPELSPQGPGRVAESLALPPARPAGQVFPIFGSSSNNVPRPVFTPPVRDVAPVQAAVRIAPHLAQPRPAPSPIDLLAPTRARSGSEITPPPATLPAYAAPRAGLSLPFGLPWSTVGAILGGFSAVLSLVVGLYFLTPQHGQLRIELAADGGAPVAKAEIFVDGHKQCDSAPCIVSDLSPGARTIQVIAPGFTTPLTSSELVEPGKERVALIALRAVVADAAPAAAATPPAPPEQAEPAPAPAAEPPVAALVAPQPETVAVERARTSAPPVSIKTMPTAAAQAQTARDKPQPTADVVQTAGMGKLNVNSLPPSKVLVDGRAFGNTPKVDITIPAGVHTVTFVHPDFARKSVTVTVKAGQGATASVRFKRN